MLSTDTTQTRVSRTRSQLSYFQRSSVSSTMLLRCCQATRSRMTAPGVHLLTRPSISPKTMPQQQEMMSQYPHVHLSPLRARRLKTWTKLVCWVQNMSTRPSNTSLRFLPKVYETPSSTPSTFGSTYPNLLCPVSNRLATVYTPHHSCLMTSKTGLISDEASKQHTQYSVRHKPSTPGVMRSSKPCTRLRNWVQRRRRSSLKSSPNCTSANLTTSFGRITAIVRLKTSICRW